MRNANFGAVTTFWSSWESSYFRSTLACLLAGVLYEAEPYDEAEAYALIAAELAADDDVETLALLRAIEAKLAARQGQWSTAEALIAQAVELLSGTDFTALAGPGPARPGKGAHRQRPCPGGARETLEEAIRLAERKEVRPEADRARTLLALLSAEPTPR